MRTPTPCLLPTQPATRELLAVTGMSPRMLRTYVSSGELVRLRQGVYVSPQRFPTTCLVGTSSGRAPSRSSIPARCRAMSRVVEQLVRDARRRDFANPRLAGTARHLLVEAAASHGRAGLGSALALTNPARESVPESLAAGHLHLAGLPAPVFQHEISSRIGWLYPDVYWPEFNLIGESDGAVKYAKAEAYVDEKMREQVLRDLGYRMVRWLAKEIMFTPWIVVDRIARALGL